MKKIAKILLVLVCLSFLFVMPRAKASIASDDVDRAYEVYRERYNYANDLYELTVYDGIVKGEVCFAIYFTPKTPNSFYLKAASANGRDSYKVPSQSGSVSLLAVSFAKDFVLTLENARGQAEPLNKQASFTVDSALDIKADSSAVSGGNDTSGVKIITLSSSSAKGESQIIITVAIFAVIGLLIAIMSVFISTHSVLYKKRKNQKTVDVAHIINAPAEEFAPVAPERVIEEKAPEEKHESFDLAKYFASLNKPWGDKNASEQDKNDMMLELMKLKESGSLSEREYKEASISLWKK